MIHLKSIRQFRSARISNASTSVSSISRTPMRITVRLFPIMICLIQLISPPAIIRKAVRCSSFPRTLFFSWFTCSVYSAFPALWLVTISCASISRRSGPVSPPAAASASAGSPRLSSPMLRISACRKAFPFSALIPLMLFFAVLGTFGPLRVSWRYSSFHVVLFFWFPAPFRISVRFSFDPFHASCSRASAAESAAVFSAPLSSASSVSRLPQASATSALSA